MVSKRTFFHTTIAALPLLLVSFNAHAVPSFARQTGLPCASCHTVFPELTPFGRSFKLNGYTLTGIKQVETKASPAASGLKVNEIPPLSAMLQTDVTTSKASGDAYALPDQLSFFFAGEISPKMGSFIQITMAPADGPGFAIDNTDIRYADRAGNVTYGLTLNNSPTVQDLWNSTAAWGFPFTGGAGVTMPVMDDYLAQQVMGLGGYADWGNGLYTELTLYRPTTVPMGDPTGAFGGVGNGTIQGMAPYVRVAWDKTFDSGSSLMVGAYGMKTDFNDSTGTIPGTTGYTDTAVDTQYELKLSGSNMLSIHATYTTEAQDLLGSSATLNQIRVDGIYHWGYHATATLGYISNSGDALTADESATTVQYSYLPWQNTKLTAQYVIDNQNSDNNTTMLQAWLMW
jgi:hypothetical protein